MLFVLAQDTKKVTEQARNAGDDITKDLTSDPSKVLQAVQDWLMEHGPTFAMNVVAALAIFIIGKIVAKFLRRLIDKIMTKGNVDETLRKFLTNVVYSVLMVFVILAAVNRLGVDTTSFAAIIAAAGLAIGFALQGSLANFASGVMIIGFKPFKVGDFIEAGGVTGVVEEIAIFCTMMRTGDNKKIVVPNSGITGGNITNYSAKDTRRIDMVIGCGYDDDLKSVKAFLIKTVTQDERILAEPEPVVAVHELADSSVNFVVRPWVKTDDYWAVHWDLTERIKVGMDQSGFSIPYPQQDVHMHQASA